MSGLLGVGVYISRVEEGSVAERAGLRPGDSILEVNGTPFTGISHEEALKVCLLYFCFSSSKVEFNLRYTDETIVSWLIELRS